MTNRIMTNDLPKIEQAVLKLLPESLKVLSHSLTLKMVDEFGRFELTMSVQVEDVFNKVSRPYMISVNRKFHDPTDKYYVADVLANMLILKNTITRAAEEAYKERQDSNSYLREILSNEINKTTRRLDGVVDKLSLIPFIGWMFTKYKGDK